MSVNEFLLVQIDRIGWLAKRFICLLIGCDIHYWSENEYIHGHDCSRCDAGEDTTGNSAPYKIIWKSESLFGFISDWFEQLTNKWS